MCSGTGHSPHLMLSHNLILASYTEKGVALFLMRKNALPIDKSSLSTAAWLLSHQSGIATRLALQLSAGFGGSQSGFSDGCMTGGEGSAY